MAIVPDEYCRELGKKIANDVLDGYVDKKHGYTIRQIVKMLENDELVPVVHGSWIEGNGGDDVCSVCGKECSDFVEGCDGIKYTEYLPNYCPNCGAKMDRRTDTAKCPHEIKGARANDGL